MSLEMSDQRSLKQRRWAALRQDALLFCGAFSMGAFLYALGHAVFGSRDAWTIGLSDGLIVSGLIAGELFVVWNNGFRQGMRGHSIGKHREGLAVVDSGTGQRIGAVRGLLRGLVTALLLDLTAAAIPIGLPTVLRRLTPEAWHVGGASYVAIVVLFVPLLLASGRSFVDVLLRTSVVEAIGPDAVTTRNRRRALVVIDVAGVLGVMVVGVLYMAFYWPLIWTFPHLW